MKTELFRTPPGPYALIEARRSGWKLGLPALLLVMVPGVLSLSDIRYGVIVIMVICVVYPMILLLAWLKITAMPGMVLRMRPQQWELNSDSSLSIRFYPFGADEESASAITEIVLTPDQIESIEPFGEYQVVYVSESDYPRYFLIPKSITKEYPTLLKTL